MLPSWILHYATSKPLAKPPVSVNLQGPSDMRPSTQSHRHFAAITSVFLSTVRSKVWRSYTRSMCGCVTLSTSIITRVGVPGGFRFLDSVDANSAVRFSSQLFGFAGLDRTYVAVSFLCLREDYFLIWMWLLSQSIASKWPVMASFIHHDDTPAVWIANCPNSDSEHLVNYEPRHFGRLHCG
ncbi:uncharacterized protein B0T23DRAFT_406004 [Neurospora hispaniola]|uniref:Uncharacterized protein n=1 Tax=Neurospora hispaniola TaxID=588809 RepID=A0AAJ0I353_9PEZI|nr:hypothetical protein B0T23DRAFT_406004 [Neurospora hispaniola]